MQVSLFRRGFQETSVGAGGVRLGGKAASKGCVIKLVTMKGDWKTRVFEGSEVFIYLIYSPWWKVVPKGVSIFCHLLLDWAAERSQGLEMPAGRG